ncbi:MAG TPA: cytochrome-c oxidase, cbb3-type subunit III [Novosphingobium sp.]|nr:cytochrome-c oxidase, cbb3-type subunit III [Novosphingobium sp.]HQA17146.1 cytochrome-c oxidase, cbb3-type subunit III [Novosphingobium sp.]
MANKKIDEATGIETVGHEWDGIEELNNPLPRWWVWTTYLTIIFAIGYMIVYPAIPMLHSATAGVWNWSSRGQLADEMAEGAAKRKAATDAIAAMSVEDLVKDEKLMPLAIAGGAAAFRQNCVQCHGSGAAGGIGFPNLKDDDWLWGGNIKEIETTLQHGIRSPDDAATRTSLMPSFGKDGILTEAQVGDAASYVLSLSGSAPNDAAAQRGAAVFQANCVACHGTDAKGMRQFGAPNLTDKVWLYGGKREQVVGSITKAHAGVMPAWGKKLDPVTIKMLAAYVHSLGGGEDFTSAPAAPASGTDGNAKP